MAKDIFSIRAMVASAERLADEASKMAVTAGSEATAALHTVRAAIGEAESAMALVTKAIEKGEEVRRAVHQVGLQQKVHPDLVSAAQGTEAALTSMEESLSNLLHLKDKLEQAHEVATRSGFPVGTIAPAQYRGAKMWLDRWVNRL